MAVCLALLLAFSMMTPAFAAENSEQAGVGYLTLYASFSGSSSGLPDYGHVFVEVVNTSDNAFNIGPIRVAPDCGITMGFWSSIDGHSGLVFNAESYLHYSKARYGDRVSISIPITLGDTYDITSVVLEKRYTSYNLIAYNCVDFALDVWYAVCTDYAFTTGKTSTMAARPEVLRESMMQFSECETGAYIARNYYVQHYGPNGLDDLTLSNINGDSSLSIEDENETMQQPTENGFVNIE